MIDRNCDHWASVHNGYIKYDPKTCSDEDIEKFESDYGWCLCSKRTGHSKTFKLEHVAICYTCKHNSLIMGYGFNNQGA